MPLSVLNTTHQGDWTWQHADHPHKAVINVVCIMPLDAWLVHSIKANAAFLGDLFVFGTVEIMSFMNWLIAGKVVATDKASLPELDAIDWILGI